MKTKSLTVRAALLEAAAWNRSDLRGIEDITPDAPMLKARAVVIGRALAEYRAERQERQRAKEEAAHLSRRIAAFDRRCAREEYTELDDAWALLHDARRLLRCLGAK